MLNYTIKVKLPCFEETCSTVSIRRYSADHRYAYENISSRNPSFGRQGFLLGEAVILDLKYFGSKIFASYSRCDSVVLTGTTCTGLVRTQYVLMPSVLLVYLSLTLRGLAVHIVSGHSPSGVQRFRSLVSSPFNIEHMSLNVLCSHISPLIYIS